MGKNNIDFSKAIFSKSILGVDSRFIIRLFTFLAGIFTLALGASLVITADLGTASWDVLHIGLSDTIGLSVGRWVQIVGFVMLAITAFFEKRMIGLGSLLNIFLLGFFINLILDSNMIPIFSSFPPKLLVLLSGSVLMGVGSGMYTATRIGSGPRDGTTLLLADRFPLSIRVSRTILEICALTLGWILGGPVAFGTFVIIILIGPIMQSSLKFFSDRIEKLYSDEKL